MKKLLFLMLLGSLVVGFLLVAACSDDDDSNPIISGDPNSPSFDLYDNTVAEIPGELAGLSINIIFGLMEHQFGGKSGRSGWLTGLGADDMVLDSVFWTYTNGWHIFYFELSELTIEPIPGGGTFEDTLTIVGWDSLRIFEDGSFVAVPSDTADSLYSRQHIVVRTRDSEGEHWYVAGHHRMTLLDEGTDITYGNLIGVDMTATDTVEADLIDPDDNECSLAMVTTLNLSDIVIPSDMLDDVCPSSGRLAATQTVNLSCGGGTATDSIAFNGTWQLLETFTNGVAFQTLTFGSIQWTHRDTCGVALTTLK